jgi:hypothetical protein
MRGLRVVTEQLARRTTRRGLFGRGSEIAFGALAGAAAGTLTRAGGASAGVGTLCNFPGGRPCPCEGCQANGVCAKPCVINTTWYQTGCWVFQGVTCCDCDCTTIKGPSACGCGSDYHNNTDPLYCPDGNASN